MLQERLLRDRGKKLMKLMKPAELAGFRRGTGQGNEISLSQRYRTPGTCIPHKGLNLVRKELSPWLNSGFQEDVGNEEPME